MIMGVILLLMIFGFMWKFYIQNVPVEALHHWPNSSSQRYKAKEDFDTTFLKIMDGKNIVAMKSIRGKPFEEKSGFTRKRVYYTGEGVDHTLDVLGLVHDRQSTESGRSGFMNTLRAAGQEAMAASSQALKKASLNLFTNFFWFPSGMVIMWVLYTFLIPIFGG